MWFVTAAKSGSPRERSHCPHSGHGPQASEKSCSIRLVASTIPNLDHGVGARLDIAPRASTRRRTSGRRAPTTRGFLAPITGGASVHRSPSRRRSWPVNTTCSEAACLALPRDRPHRFCNAHSRGRVPRRHGRAQARRAALVRPQPIGDPLSRRAALKWPPVQPQGDLMGASMDR
jgi:hypothetical protein